MNRLFAVIVAAGLAPVGAAQAQGLAPGQYTLLETLAGGGCSAGYSAVAAAGSLAGYDSNGDGQVCVKPYSAADVPRGGGAAGGLGGAGALGAGLGLLVLVGAMGGSSGGS